MAKSVNVLTISGNLGRDPEIRYSANGNPICNASVAVGFRDKGESGKYEDKTMWVNLVAFGKTAEYLANYGFKGCPATATGELRAREYTTKQGETRHVTECIVNSITLHKRKDDAPAATGNGRSYSDDADDGAGFSDQF